MNPPLSTSPPQFRSRIFFGVRSPELPVGAETVAELESTDEHAHRDRDAWEDKMAARRGRFVDRRMQRAREQLPAVEAIRRAAIALCDRPYCLSSDEMATLGDVFVYNDAHGS